MRAKKVLGIVLAGALTFSAMSMTAMADEAPRIALLMASMTTEFFVQIEAEARAYAEEVGVDLEVYTCDNDSAKELANMETILSDAPDIILYTPNDSDAATVCVEKANEAGVPVITFDRGSNGGEVVSHIASDNELGGEMAGEYIREIFPDGAKVIEIVGTPGSTGQIERSKGFYEVIDQHDNIELLSSQVGNNMRTEAQQVTENMVQAYGKDGIDVIVAQNDEMVMGALQALDGLGIAAGEDIVLCTIGDGNQEVVTNIVDGRIGAAYESTPYLGAQVVEVAYKIFVTEDTSDVPKYIPSNNRFFTIENAAAELPKVTW